VIWKVALDVLIVLLSLAQIITLFFTLYQVIISILGFSFGKIRANSRGDIPSNRFAVIVCAHNEEAVVGHIVDNLNALDYPKELYDVYVICDNCTDKTAEVVRSHGGIAMERHDPDKKGKGYGLEWMFEKLWMMEREGNKYDAVAIFDADNLVSRNFLKTMNSKLLQGYEVAQAYLDSKNPNDTWITKSYAFSYWATNRVFQLARERIGLSAQLGGTGLMVSTKVLKEMGWGATSLTEDLEFTARYLLSTNNRVAWVHEAKIYDEKPLKMKASFRQRIRWMKGHIDCAIRYSLPLLKKMIKGGGLKCFDMFIYLVQPSKIVLALNSFVFLLISLFHPIPREIDKWIVDYWVWTTIILINYIIPVIGVIQEKHAKSLLWMIQVYIFALSWIPIIVIAFIKRKDKNWTHTQHGRNLSAEELTRVSL
jgi:cellulose synthase/poly-beta-1,6-N-acetylglucosamine synthase-like glycosyltransferase